MGLFSSSWKYYAYAGSSTIFDEKDHPHTFQQIMLEGLRVDESFSNILAFAFRTDMYARSKAMVKYALKEPDGYIRGLPTSDLLTFNIELEYVRGSVKRDVKAPIEDFYWFQHGTFDPSFLVRKFIHDNYLNINYFPWPEGCLTPLLNPRFNDVEANWTVQGNVEFLPQYDGGLDYTARLIASDPKIYNDAIGNVVPGQIITLTAVCDRGGGTNVGILNLTFYNAQGVEISTASAANTSTPSDKWELLTVIAAAPAGSVTCKAWAGATVDGQLIRVASAAYPEKGSFAPYCYISCWPSTEGVNKSQYIYYESGPSYDWAYRIHAWDTNTTGAGQKFWKITLDYIISGVDIPLMLDEFPINVWYDIWDDEDEVSIKHFKHSGVMQWAKVTLHVTTGIGGNPDLTAVTTYPIEMMAYWGLLETKIEDLFNLNNGDLESNIAPPNKDRRHFNGGSLWAGWRDVYYAYYGNYDQGWISVNTLSEGWARSLDGDVNSEALYAIDGDLTNFRIESEIRFDCPNYASPQSAAGGIAFRIQDALNFLLLAVKNPEVANPIMGIYKVTAGVHTLLGGLELTGYGPLSTHNKIYIYRLTCVDNLIIGELCLHVNAGGGAGSPFNQQNKLLSVTEAAYNTETEVGLWARDIDFRWNDFHIFPWPLGGNNGAITDRTWDIFVWDSTPASGSVTDCGTAVEVLHIYSNSNGKIEAPLHASYGFTDTAIPYPSWLNWRLTQASDDTFLVQFEYISGDSAATTLAEYGQYNNARAWGEWGDASGFFVYLEAPVSTSKTITFRARFGLAELPSSYENRTVIPGSESVWKTITMSAHSTGPCPP